jgi:hypothetical protein
MRWALLVLVAVGGTAAAQTELAWKWKEGQTFYVETTTQVKQTAIVADPTARPLAAPGLLGWALATLPPKGDNDRELSLKFELVSLVRYTVKKANADGSAEVEQAVLKQLVKAADVEKDAALSEVALTLHVDARGRVSKVTGLDKLLASLSDLDSGKRATLTALLSPEVVSRSATQALGFLPPKAAKTWEQEVDAALGPLGTLILTRSFTAEGSGKQKLSWTVKDGRYQPGKAPDKGPSPSALVTGGQFGRIEGSGSLTFDAEAGRLVDGTSTLKLKGFVTVKSGDAVYRMTITQEQEAKTRVLDQPPAPPKPMK